MTREVPVTLVVWYCLTQTFDALEDELDRCLHALWAKHLHNFLIDFLNGERLIDGTHWVHLLLFWLLQFSLASLVGLFDDALHLTFLEKLDSCTEHAEFLQSCHIDTIIIWIANLRRTRYHYDLLRMQAVEDAEDTLLQSCTTHDTIVDDDEIVNMWLNTSVGNIIHMARQIISAVALRDESPEFDILPSYVL